MPRHAPGHRVDSVSDFSPIILKYFAQLPDCMLGLGNRHAIARKDHNGAGGFKYIISVFGRNRFGFTLNCSGISRSCGPQSPKQHIAQRSIHGFAHDAGQDQAAGSHQ